MADQLQYTATVSILEQMDGTEHVRLVITDDETGETVKDTTLNPSSVFPEERNPRGLTGRVLGGSGFKMSGNWLAEPTSFPVTLHVTRA